MGSSENLEKSMEKLLNPLIFYLIIYELSLYIPVMFDMAIWGVYCTQFSDPNRRTSGGAARS